MREREPHLLQEHLPGPVALVDVALALVRAEVRADVGVVDARDLLVDLADLERHDAEVAVHLRLEERDARALAQPRRVDDDDLVVLHADVQVVVEVLGVLDLGVLEEPAPLPLLLLDLVGDAVAELRQQADVLVGVDGVRPDVDDLEERVAEAVRRHALAVLVAVLGPVLLAERAELVRVQRRRHEEQAALRREREERLLADALALEVALEVLGRAVPELLEQRDDALVVLDAAPEHDVVRAVERDVALALEAVEAPRVLAVQLQQRLGLLPLPRVAQEVRHERRRPHEGPVRRLAAVRRGHERRLVVVLRLVLVEHARRLLGAAAGQLLLGLRERPRRAGLQQEPPGLERGDLALLRRLVAPAVDEVRVRRRAERLAAPEAEHALERAAPLDGVGDVEGIAPVLAHAPRPRGGGLRLLGGGRTQDRKSVV